MEVHICSVHSSCAVCGSLICPAVQTPAPLLKFIKARYLGRLLQELLWVTGLLELASGLCSIQMAAGLALLCQIFLWSKKEKLISLQVSNVPSVC